MPFLKIATVFLVIYTISFLSAQSVFGMETYTVNNVSDDRHVRFNNENWLTILHPTVASVSIDENGNSFGLTQNNIAFTQKNIPNTLGIRIQKFVMEDHYHYIVEGETAYTPEDLSILLSKYAPTI